MDTVAIIVLSIYSVISTTVAVSFWRAYRDTLGFLKVDDYNDITVSQAHDELAGEEKMPADPKVGKTGNAEVWGDNPPLPSATVYRELTPDRIEDTDD